MKTDRPSRTAEGVAAIRAAETILLPPEARVFEDPIAARMASARMRLLLKAPWLLRGLHALHRWRFPGVAEEVPVRARFALDRLRRALEEGVRQTVVIGAGFDATGWLPDLPEDLVVYEVDRPETQRLKRQRLARAGVGVPARVVFVPHRLGGGGLPAALSAAGHDRGRPSFVTLLGVLPYLTPAETRDAFADIARCCAPGSEVVYGFFSRDALDPARAAPGARRMGRKLRRLGEPWRSAADPDEMARLVSEAGLRATEVLDGEALTRRYLARCGTKRAVGRWVNLARAVSLRSPSG